MDRAFLEGLLGEDAEVVDAIMAQHQKELADMALGHTLSRVISDAGGRNEKAVMALLDMEAIRASDDPKAAAAQALAALKKSDDYLFVQAAPRYAAGTGTGNFEQPAPKSLAEALRAKFGK